MISGKQMANVKKSKRENEIQYIKKLNITLTSGYVIVSADINSKSRPGLIHYTRILIDPSTRTIIKESCDCEGFVFKRKCWHIQLLKSIINI